MRRCLAIAVLCATIALSSSTAGATDNRVVARPTIAGNWATIAIDDHVAVSHDGGRTFRRVPVPRRGVVVRTMLASGLGYGVSAGGRLWRTGDAGRHWHRTPIVATYAGVQAVSTSAWVIGERRGVTILAGSDDGGRHWHRRRLRVSNVEGPAADVSFADAADGVLSALAPQRSGGAAFLETTHDGGRTWRRRRGAPCPPAYTGFKGPPSVTWLASGALWLTCRGQSGAGAEGFEIKQSLDGGRTFALEARASLPGGKPRGAKHASVGRPPGGGHLQSVDAVSDSEAFCGFGYGLNRTFDGGRTWRAVRLPVTLDGSGDELASDGRSWLLSLGSQGLWRSPDAGAHWRRVRLPPV